MTRTRLANNILVPAAPSGLSPALTQSLSMEDSNAVNVQLTVLSGGSATMTLTATVQGSDDLENWLTTGLTGNSVTIAAASVVAGTVTSFQTTAVGYAYTRVVFTNGGTGQQPTLLAVDANTYKN